MTVSSISQYGNLVFESSVSLGAGATPLPTGDPKYVNATEIQGYIVTNNDPTNVVYLGFTSAVSSNHYIAALPANGGSFRINASKGIYAQTYVAGMAGVNVEVAVLA